LRSNKPIAAALRLRHLREKVTRHRPSSAAGSPAYFSLSHDFYGATQGLVVPALARGPILVTRTGHPCGGLTGDVGIRDGSVKGSVITFTVTRDIGDRVLVLDNKETISDGKSEFTVKPCGPGWTTNMTATRKK
jgi:hypothetical protein